MRDLTLLHPELFKLYLAFAGKMEKHHLPFIVTCTLRSATEHLALWSQGRELLSDVNSLRSKAGWAPITEEQNRKKVTWTKTSLHFADKNGYARAFDIALVYPDKKQPHWDGKVNVNANEFADYNEAAIYAREIGLIPGIDFNDPCHFQLSDSVV